MTAFYVFDGIKIKKQKKKKHHNQYIVRCRSNIEHPNGAKQCYRQTCFFFSGGAFLCAANDMFVDIERIHVMTMIA